MAYGDITQREQAALIPHIWAIRAQQMAAERERQWALEDQRRALIEAERKQQQAFQNEMAMAQYAAKQQQKIADISLKERELERQYEEKKEQREQVEARAKEERVRKEKITTEKREHRAALEKEQRELLEKQRVEKAKAKAAALKAGVTEWYDSAPEFRAEIIRKVGSWVKGKPIEEQSAATVSRVLNLAMPTFMRKVASRAERLAQVKHERAKELAEIAAKSRESINARKLAQQKATKEMERQLKVDIANAQNQEDWARIELRIVQQAEDNASAVYDFDLSIASPADRPSLERERALFADEETQRLRALLPKKRQEIVAPETSTPDPKILKWAYDNPDDSDAQEYLRKHGE